MLSSRLPLLISLALVVLTLAAYGQLWDNEFIDLDDGEYIEQNPDVLRGLSFQGIQWAWETTKSGSRIPVTWMSLQLDASLATLLQESRGISVPLAVVCHGQNLLWHTATVVLLFVVLRRMTGALWRSALVAALFAVHPLHVESVAWAIERKDVLSTFFWVLTLLLYARYVEKPGVGRYLLVVVSFAAGLLAKPMLVTLPCTLLLLDFWPLGRFRQAAAAPSSPPGQTSSWRLLGGLVLEKVPLFVIALIASVLVVLSQHEEGAVQGLTEYSRAARLANAVQSYGWYLGKTFWPTGLAIYYCHPREHWQLGPVLLSGVVLVALTVLAVALARKSPWLLVGWLWFLGTFVPVIGLVQIADQARADRYVYVPHLGLFVALVWGGSALLQRLRLPGAVQVSLAALCLLVLTALTWAQVGFWHDAESNWKHALAVTTENHKVHDSLAHYYFHRGLATGDVEMLHQARQHLQQAVELDAEFANYWNNLGLVLLQLSSREEAERCFKQATELAPDSAFAWHHLGVAQRQQRKYAEAISCLSRALELNRQTQTRAELGLSPWYLHRLAGEQMPQTHAELGLCLWHLHRHEEAEQHWRAALGLNPSQATALYGLGLGLLRKGQLRSAQELFAAIAESPGLGALAWSQRGLALARLGEWEQAQFCQARALELEQKARKGSGGDPVEMACYRCRRAAALRSLGRDAEAKQEYTEALRLDPGWPERHLAQAWLPATAPESGERDPQTGRELAEQVCQAMPLPTAEALDVLAAAQAALERYVEAAATARQALERATTEKSPAMRQRLQLYEMGKPFVSRAGPS